MEKKITTSYIQGRVIRETEKAILINCIVKWGDGKNREKEIWFPKSTVVDIMTNDKIDVADWFLNKLEDNNSFKGYRMKIRVEDI